MWYVLFFTALFLIIAGGLTIPSIEEPGWPNDSWDRLLVLVFATLGLAYFAYLGLGHFYGYLWGPDICADADPFETGRYNPNARSDCAVQTVIITAFMSLMIGGLGTWIISYMLAAIFFLALETYEKRKNKRCR